MALLPSRTKYRKVHKGRIYGTAQTCNTLAFAEFGIQSLTRGRMTSQQLEAARVAMTRSLKRKGMPLRLRLRVIATRAASSCCEVMRPRVRDCIPNSAKASVLQVCAVP